jgi:hypothetical protein
LRREAGATTSKYAADGVGNDADRLKRSKYFKNKKMHGGKGGEGRKMLPRVQNGGRSRRGE